MKRALLQGMEERFDEMEEKEMYALATYLDPRYKGFFFQNPENASTAKQKIAEKLKKLLLEDPSFQNVDGQASMNMENESPLGMEDEPSEPKKAKTTLSDTKAEIMKRCIFAMQNSPKMEVSEFLEEYSTSMVMEEDGDVFDYWKTMSKSTKRIERAAAKLAEYYLTPPPTSVDVERLFSTAGDIITNERNRLLPENAAMILFLRENMPRVNYDY